MSRPNSPEVLELDLAAEEKELEVIAESLERSRKRNLSAGLLRGDQAADRLRLQESGASPLLKKQKKMAMTMAEFEAFMNRNVTKRLDNVDDNLSGLKSKLGTMENKLDGVDNTVKNNSTKLTAHEKAINGNKQSIEEIRSELKKMAASKDAVPPAAPNGNPMTNDNYTKARRSLRIWPVLGTSSQELWTSAGTFMRYKLDLEGRIANSMIESITRVDIPSGPGAVNEVLIRFRDIAARDMVMGTAAKLANCIDNDGKPTAGIRLEVPPHLQADFRTLFRLGQSLRSRHGQGTRRHVKFNDDDQSLFLNVKLPDDEHWSRVSVQMAKRSLASRPVLGDEDLERRLDLGGPHVDPRRPRSASSSTQGSWRSQGSRDEPRRPGSTSS